MSDTSERLALGAARYLRAVSDFAVELAALPADSDIHRLIGERLRSVTGAFAVTVSSYHAAERELRIEHIAMDDDARAAALRLLGHELRGRRVPTHPEQFRRISTEIVRTEDELAPLTLGAIPAEQGAVLQQELGLGPCTALSFFHAGELLGTALLAMRRPDPAPPHELVLALANVAAVTLHGKRLEGELLRLAHQDQLTGLPNRSLLLDRLGQAVAHARRSARPLAVLMLDLDRFKEVNDTLGHPAGDLLLQTVAGRLAAAVRQSDTVARMGGDEFVIVLLDVNGFSGVSRVAQRIRESIAGPVTLAGRSVQTAASIGIALHPNDGADAAALLKNADIAMYRAKEAGRNMFRFFEPAMSEAAAERSTLEEALRAAIEGGEFVLHYQPQVDLEQGTIVGVEALVRWPHRVRGLIPPASFIPLAEETGLISPLGEWVLRAACRQAAAWDAAGIPPVRIAVNVSPRQLRDRTFPLAVTEALAEAGLPAGRLELEITESAAMESLEACLGALQRLRDIGVHVALDDFGTGYSSLTQLRRLPIDTLKIGQQFVRDVVEQPESAAVITAIVDLGRSFRIGRLVVEGVETPKQLALLRSLGCTTAQGYLFARPGRPDEIGELLRAGRLRVEAVSGPLPATDAVGRVVAGK